MTQVGVRQFKRDAHSILRQVREDGEAFTITHRGKAIARLAPLDDSDWDGMTIDELFDAWDALTANDPEMPVGNYAVEAIRESRGRLDWMLAQSTPPDRNLVDGEDEKESSWVR